MSIYVDEMQVCIQSAKWPYTRACHLVADSVEELKEFATRLGLHPSWFQNKPELPHFDLTTRMRQKAVRMGAVELNRKKFLKLTRKYRDAYNRRSV